MTALEKYEAKAEILKAKEAEVDQLREDIQIELFEALAESHGFGPGDVIVNPKTGKRALVRGWDTILQKRYAMSRLKHWGPTVSVEKKDKTFGERTSRLANPGDYVKEGES